MTKSSKIHPVLKEKLKKTEQLYAKVTKFSELLPLYAKSIIANEHTSDQYCQLASHHKKLPANWGINWYTNIPTNYPEDTIHPNGLVNIYINCISLFNEETYPFAHEELNKVLPSIKVHFYDSWNSTFYFLPEEAEEGLDKLNDWYVATKEKTNDYLKQKRKEKLQAELDKLLKEETK